MTINLKAREREITLQQPVGLGCYVLVSSIYNKQSENGMIPEAVAYPVINRKKWGKTSCISKFQVIG